MELQHINIKLYLENAQIRPEELVPIFHEWIQEQRCGELLIDVADYRHVHNGPGVVLIGHEADYSLDNSMNRLGLRYNRKAVVNGSNKDRLSQALSAALKAGLSLQSDSRLAGRLRFERKTFNLFVNDRGLAPNVKAVREKIAPELMEFLQTFFEGSIEIAWEADPRKRLGAEIKLSEGFALKGLLDKLEQNKRAEGAPEKAA